MRKLILASLILCLGAATVASAKKDEFALKGKKKFKPRNEKILKIEWSRGLKAGSPGRRYAPETSEPAVADGTVFVGTQGKVFYAINAGDGKIRWQREFDDPIASKAAFADGRVYFTDLGGHVNCVNAADGSVAWQQTFSREMLGRPLLSQGHVYLIQGEKTVLALAQDDGHVVWKKTLSTFIRDMTMRGHADIVADGNTLYLGLADGQLYALNPANGGMLWTKTLAVPLKTFKDVDAGVVIEGDSLYVGGYSTGFYRLNKNNGGEIWRADVNTGLRPVLLDDKVIVTDTDGRAVALDKASGRELWANELNESVASEPALLDGRIFVATYDQDGFLLDPANGDQVQRLGLAQGALSAPTPAGDSLLVLTNGGQLLSLAKN